MNRIVIEVVRNPMGWWDVRREDGRVATRYVSEFQAWEAGRALAERCGAHLVIRQEHGPVKYGGYDPVARTVRPLVEVERPKAPAWTTGPSRRLILVVVEGAIHPREVDVEHLNYAGFSVVTANSHEAIALAKVLQPDLILMHVGPSGTEGLEAACDMKADPTLSGVPIIAVARGQSEETCARARRAGCTVIANPPVPQQVATYIAQVLKGDPAGMPDLAGQG